MTQPRRLSHPPIQEATIDFHLTGATSVDVDAMARVAQSIAQPDWQTRKLNHYRASLNLNTANAQGGDLSLKELTHSFDGYLVQDSAGEVVVQIRPDRITASHVKKYAAWEDLIAVGLNSLQKHVAISCASRINRIGTRYINRLKLPSLDFHAFEGLLVRVPELFDGTQLGILTDFTVDQVLRDLGSGWTAKVRIGTVMPLPGESQNSLLVDVDIFKGIELGTNIGPDDPNLIEARQLKNELFFGAVTDLALEPYQ